MKDAHDSLRTAKTMVSEQDCKAVINLDWPQQIDEGEFLRRIKSMPKGKSFQFLG